jgi:O-antigen ligase
VAFFLTVFYIAIIFVRPQEWFDFMRGWPILDVMAVLCISVTFLAGNFSADKFHRSPLNKLILLFWAALVLSQFTNFSVFYTRQAFELFSKVVIVYFLIVFNTTDIKKLKVLAWSLVLCATFLAVQSTFQYYTGAGLGGTGLLARGEVMQTRGVGIFSDPNDLSLNVLSFLSFVLPPFHRGFLSPTWLTGLPFIIIMATGIIYTRSRGGILGFAAVLWFYFHRRVGLLLSIGALMLLFSLLLAVPRMESLKAPGDASARSRLNHWSRGLNLFKQHPVFGVGMTWYARGYTHTAHNSFVLVLSETGFVGAFFWVGLFFHSFRTLFRLRKLPNAPPWLAPLVNCLQGSLIGWLVSGYFLSQSYKFTAYILMACVVATLHSLAAEGMEVEVPWRGRETRLNFLLTIGAIVFLYASLILLWRVTV